MKKKSKLNRSLKNSLAIAGLIYVASINKVSANEQLTPMGQPIKAPTLTTKQKVTPANELVNQGLAYLKERNYEDAQKVFNATAKISPNSPTVHILNGIGYHLGFLKGTLDDKALAETSYEVAFNLDTSSPIALIQLGRLHVDSGEYSKASKEFVRALSLSPANEEALYGLLQASLLLKDLKTSLWAANGLEALNTENPEYQKLLALTYAIAGQTDKSNGYYKKYSENPAISASAASGLKSQIAYINKQNLKYAERSEIQPGIMKVANNLSTGSQANNPIANLAPSSEPKSAGGNAVNPGPNNPNQNPTTPSPGKKVIKGKAAKTAASNNQNNDSSDDSSDDSSSDGSTSSSGGTQPMGMAPQAGMGGGYGGGYGGGGDGGGGGGGGNSSSQSTQRQKWFDCDSKPGLSKAPGGSYGVPVGGTTGDQTLYLEPLPAPCQGQKAPKMAMIDAILIRTVDAQSSSNGVNLLTGLQIFAGAQRTTTTGQMPTNASVIGVGSNVTSATLNGVSGLVNYSMNIANSTTMSSQVVARPTLTALDRIPSTFYSGQVQTVGLNGGGVSGAQVSNVPTGTSLSVTPTFIDDESMMLAVKVSRSFIDSTSPVGGFNAGISTQNHNVTANVRIKYGETLVLDGLTDREYDKNRNGVPILQDIPIIQYLFSNVTKSTYAENVVVLVTPRRVVSSPEDLKRLESEMLKKSKQFNSQELAIYKQINEYNKLINLTSNLDTSLMALNQDSSYYRSVKDQMLITSDWIAESHMQKFLNDAANTLYFH